MCAYLLQTMSYHVVNLSRPRDKHKQVQFLFWLDTGTESCQRTVIVLALYMGCMGETTGG